MKSTKPFSSLYPSCWVSSGIAPPPCSQDSGCPCETEEADAERDRIDPARAEATEGNAVDWWAKARDPMANADISPFIRGSMTMENERSDERRP